MTISYFQPEVWSARILSKLPKSLVFGGVANKDYEGDISAMGDTVRITSITDPTISAYTKDTDLGAVEAIADAETVLYINQADSFNFQIDDMDKAQVASASNIMSDAANRAAFGLADVADQYLAKQIALGTTNALGVIDATTATNVYDLLVVPASVKLDEANVPTEGRWLIVAPAAYGKLLLDSRFVKANESGTNALQNGIVGEAGGFTIYKSNNVPTAGRTIAVTVTVATTAKTLTAAAGTFTQGDVGLGVSGTRITGSAGKIVSVNAAGTVATMDTDGATAGTSTDIVLAGATKLAFAGYSGALTYAEQINKVVAYSPEARFGDALKGLHLYGAKVTRPSGLVVASLKTA
jgi:hypothetical protein